MDKQQLLAMYYSVGNKVSDFKDDIRYLGVYPDNESFDCSLAIYHLAGFIMVADCGNGGLTFIDTIS